MVFLPFTVQTDKPQQYLREGLADILASRLTAQTGQIAVHRSRETTQLATLLRQDDQQAFTNILKKIDADYVIIGSLEQQNTNYEITIYVFNQKSPLPSSFSKTIPSLNKAISAMDELSADITEQIFNKKRSREKTGVSSENQGISAFQTTHPDRAFRDGLYQASGNPGIEDENIKLQSSWQSEKISEKVRAMDAADLNGDGEQEIVLVQMGSIAIYHCNNGRFEQVTEQLISDYLTPHAVGLADLDGNGLLEIYISANIGDKPSSLVLEWDGSDIHTLYEKIPYYIRLGTNLEGKQILIGQNGSNKGITGRSFCQLIRSQDGSLLAETNPFTVPEAFNLFDFIRVDLDKNGTLEFVGLTVDNRLVVMDQAGTLLWASVSGYGASKLFLGATEENMEEDFMPRYLHTRLIARDLDGDGTPEIIVGRNRISSTVKYFHRLRFFKGSSINALLWDGSGMTTFWETKMIPGYLVDYQLLQDSSHPDRMHLYFVESSNNSPLFFWKSESSIIHLYEMGPRETERPKR